MYLDFSKRYTFWNGGSILYRWFMHGRRRRKRNCFFEESITYLPPPLGPQGCKFLPQSKMTKNGEHAMRRCSGLLLSPSFPPLLARMKFIAYYFLPDFKCNINTLASKIHSELNSYIHAIGKIYNMRWEFWSKGPMGFRLFCPYRLELLVGKSY